MLSGERVIHDRLHFYLLYVFLTISLCFRGVKECHPLGPFWLDTAGGRLDIEKARKLGSLVIHGDTNQCLFSPSPQLWAVYRLTDYLRRKQLLKALPT